MPREKNVDIDDDELEREGGGAVVEFDEDDGDSPFDLAAEQEHMDRRFPAEPADEDAADADDTAMRAVRRRQVRRTAGEDQDGDDQGDDGDDEDLSGYGQKVQKRIKRLTAKHRHEERRAQAAEQAANEALGKAQALEQQLSQMVGTTLDQNVERMTSDLESKQKLLKDAIENGDTEAQVDLTNDLIEIRSHLNLARLRRPAAPPAGKADDEGGDQGQDRQRQAAAPNRQDPTPSTAAWLSENSFWFGDRKTAWARKIAIEIDNELTAEGYQSDDEHYAELNRRLLEADERMADFVEEPREGAGRKPGRRSRRQPADDGGRQQPRRRMNSPVSPADGNGGSRNGKTRVTLTAGDLKQIEAWGLDPSDPKVVQRFARERLATDADFNQRGHR